MIPRRSTQRKYRPGLEPLESKQLLSGGPTTYGSQVLVPPTSPVSSQVEHPPFCPRGTGKGIRIPTS
jgi:hypothetical protein